MSAENIRIDILHPRIRSRVRNSKGRRHKAIARIRKRIDHLGETLTKATRGIFVPHLFCWGVSKAWRETNSVYLTTVTTFNLLVLPIDMVSSILSLQCRKKVHEVRLWALMLKHTLSEEAESPRQRCMLAVYRTVYAYPSTYRGERDAHRRGE